jgi:hypothetical protein
VIRNSPMGDWLGALRRGHTWWEKESRVARREGVCLFRSELEEVFLGVRVHQPKRGVANLHKEVTVSLFGRYVQAALQPSTYAILH